MKADNIKKLIETWQNRQVEYENLALKYENDTHNYKKYTYKAMATRDCWKELLNEIKE